MFVIMLFDRGIKIKIVIPQRADRRIPVDRGIHRHLSFPHASGGNPEFMMDLFKNMLTNIRYRLQISYFLIGHAMGVGKE
ncbi:MAG: hypothetical protein WAW31_09195 [Smithella sp.]|jgi:hypothetical protein